MTVVVEKKESVRLRASPRCNYSLKEINSWGAIKLAGMQATVLKPASGTAWTLIPAAEFLHELLTYGFNASWVP